MASEPIITRDYIDNYAVKEFVQNGLIDSYFDDIDVDLRTISMVGYTTELISNCSEDAFNTGSVLFRESFPNRAQIDESIYSHAAIFQLDDIFSSAASCKFLLVLEEEAIIKNMMSNTEFENEYSSVINISPSRNMYYFCISKDTTIYVDDTPFTLDYDILMTIAKKVTDIGDEYLFSARYVTETYTNSISDISDPYVKVRRSNDGYIALEVHTHQCQRQVEEEIILSNNEINYPVIDVSYEGQLAGFDVLYKEPSSDRYIQMETLIVYSQPLKSEFCYYQLMDSATLRITFNTKDVYFMPEFNSELKIILYLTGGFDGNFDTYVGTNITCVPDSETYAYANDYLSAAQPVGSSKDGKDETDTEALQALAVEGYRTANAITTDSDLQNYFNNYKYRYGNLDILFIKKRDDIFERIFSAFTIMRKGEYIYKTNTLNLSLNLFDMNNVEKDVYILEPGTVFTANEDTGYAEFFRDKEKTEEYLALYQTASANGETPFVEDVNPGDIPDYLDRSCSFAEFKSRKGLDDKLSVWDLTEQDYEDNDNPSKSKFLLINPFLIKFTKSPNLVSTYMTYVDNAVTLDFIEQNSDMYLQFTMYTFYMSRRFTKEKKYDVTINIAPSMAVDEDNYLVATDGVDENGSPIFHLNDKYSVANNDLRVIMVIMSGIDKLCYAELYPTEYDQSTGNIKFQTTLYTDDFITSTGKLKIDDGKIYLNTSDYSYFKVQDIDKTLYDYYNSAGEKVGNPYTSTEVQEIIELDPDTWKEWVDVHNMTGYDNCMAPLNECEVKIYTLYNKEYSESANGLTPILSGYNDFVNFDPSLANYTWTNVYATEEVTFMKAMDSVRSYLEFKDWSSAGTNDDGEVVFPYDILDAEMKSISFLRASELLDEEMTDYFFNTFYQNYKFLEDVITLRLRNATGLDIKFYNTYGRSRDFIIGEDGDILNTVNLSLAFDVWFTQETDTSVAVPELKRYIKSQIETINSKGMNSLYISNLMRKIEITYSYVDHIRFKQINLYDSEYQAVKNYVTDLDDLTVEERRWYVPEMLVCDIDDIYIMDYYVQ